MWSTITNVNKAAAQVCHACRRKIHYSRNYFTNHTLSNTFPCRLKSSRTYFATGCEQRCNSNFRKLDTVVRCQGHLDEIGSVRKKDSSLICDADIQDKKNVCTELRELQRSFENKSQKFIKALHRLNCEHKSKLHSQTNERVNTLLSAESDIKCSPDKADKLKYLTAFQGRKCSCMNNSIKPLKDIHKHFCVGLVCVNGVLFNRKTDNDCKSVCAFHTSAKKWDSQKRHGGNIRQKPPWRILFFGTDDIALPTLKDLYSDMIGRGALVESLEVVTVKEQRAVRAFAESVKLKIHEWPVAIETERYDVGVLVSFGHLIHDAVIHMFPYGILNMHPSLLPRWRGASPVIHTVLNGDDVTGVSVMEIRPKHFDIGPILLQRECQVPHRCTSHQLADILGRFGASMMLECLKDLPTMERFEHEQDRSGITYAHKIKHKNANIDWENSTAEEVDCQYRAIAKLIPMKTEMDEHTLKLYDVIEPDHFKDVNCRDIRGYHGNIFDSEPGTVVYYKPLKCIVVKCKHGFIGFKTVVLRRKLTALDFFNGYINKNRCTKFTSLDNDLNKYIKMERIPMKSKA